MKTLLGIFVVVLGLVATLRAESIGINFVGKDAKAQTLEATQSTGAADVAQDHWNNLETTAVDANGHGNSGNLAKVQDNAGKEIKGASAAVTAKPNTQFWPTDAASWGFGGNDLILQSGSICPRPTITIKGIPYKSYAVYLYATAGDNGGHGSATIAAKAVGKVDATATRFCKLNWQEGKFVKSEAKTLDEAKSSEGSNYMVFTGNTAHDITIEFNGTLSGGWIGVSGVQIVATPDAK